MDLAKRPEFIGTPRRSDHEGPGRAQPQDLGSRRVLTHARSRSQGAGGATRRGPPVHRSGPSSEASPTSASLATRFRRESRGRRSSRRVIDGLRTLGEHAKGSGVAVIIESHGDFTDAPSLARDPRGRRDAECRAALGRAPHVRREQGRSGGDVQARSAPTFATRTSRTRGPRATASDTSSQAPEPSQSGRRSACWQRLAIAATTASSGRRSGTRKSRSRRSRFPQYAQLDAADAHRRRGNAQQGLITGRRAGPRQRRRVTMLRPFSTGLSGPAKSTGGQRGQRRAGQERHLAA